jgi:hypothetical protein
MHDHDSVWRPFNGTIQNDSAATIGTPLESNDQQLIQNIAMIYMDSTVVWVLLGDEDSSQPWRPYTCMLVLPQTQLPKQLTNPCFQMLFTSQANQNGPSYMVVGREIARGRVWCLLANE